MSPPFRFKQSQSLGDSKIMPAHNAVSFEPRHGLILRFTILVFATVNVTKQGLLFISYQGMALAN